VKRLITFLRLFVFTILLGALFTQQGYCSSRYYHLESNEYGIFSLDTITFHVTKDNNWIYFDIWIKDEYTEKGIEDYKKSRQSKGLPTKGYEKTSYSLTHEIFATNPSRKILAHVGYAVYDKYGTSIENTTLSSLKYEEVIPGSVGEALCNEVINYCIANNISPQ